MASPGGSSCLITPPLDHWIDTYLNGELKDVDMQAFERWLLEDYARVERLARAVLQDTHLRAAVMGRRLESGFSMLDAESEDNDERLKAIDKEIMAGLVDQALAERRRREVEDAANALLLAEHAESRRDRHYERVQQSAIPASNRVIVIPRLVVWASLAAAVLIVAVLAYQVGQPESAPPSVAEQPSPTPPANMQVQPQPEPQPDPQPQSPPVLASVVRSLDARWADVAETRGNRGDLVQGEYMLVGGLVEIQLAEGARVVLEAPVSIELTGRNEMFLRNGRLVAQVPPSAYGFTVDTPTARIIDYGTEFGVHADASRSTAVQVYQGEVRAVPRRNGATVGSAEPLLAQEAAMIDARGEKVERVAFDAEAFERQVVKRLDLVDIVAGGDGTGISVGGVDILTGRQLQLPASAGALTDSDYSQPGQRWQAATANEMVDGVFLLPLAQDSVQIDSAGHTLDVPEPKVVTGTAETVGHVWAANRVPLHRDEIRHPDAATPFLVVGQPELGDRMLVMHSAKGITLDLQAISLRHDRKQPVRFRTSVLNMAGLLGPDRDSRVPDLVDVLVIVDGVVRERQVGLTFRGGPAKFDVEIRPDDRYLALVVTDGGDGQQYDWLIWGRPVLELQP